MTRSSFSHINSAMARALDDVGDKWTIMLLRNMVSGRTKFDHFVNDLGIARNILTQRLRQMEKSGLITKAQYSDKPIRYEYRLTDKGYEFHEVMLVLQKWGTKWCGDIAPAMVNVHRPCNNPVDVEVVCTTCKVPVKPGDNYAIKGPAWGEPMGFEGALEYVRDGIEQ